MVAPLVVVLSITDCDGPYAPAATEKVGVATAPLIVYVADATAESENVDLVANALMVIELETLIADEY